MKKFVVILMLCLFTNVTVYSSSLEDAKIKKNELENKQKQLIENKEAIDKQIYKLSEEIRKIDEIQVKISNKIKNLNSDIVKKNKEIKIITQKRKEQEILKKEKFNVLKKRMKYLYENGNDIYINKIKSSKTLYEFQNNSEYISQIVSYDKNIIDELNKLIVDIKKEEFKLKTAKEDLETKKENLKKENLKITQLLRNKKEVMLKYDEAIKVLNNNIYLYSNAINNQQKIIDNILAEEIRKKEEAQKEAARLYFEEQKKKKEELNNNVDKNINTNTNINTNIGNTSNSNSISNTNNFNSKFIWPTRSGYRVSSGFGQRVAPNVHGATSYHEGIDIPVPMGSDVLASADGIVIISSYHYSAGNYVMIAHNDSISTVYMHNSVLLVNVGDRVKQGQVIALAGSTGASTGSHIHIGFKVDGVYKDPLKYLSR